MPIPKFFTLSLRSQPERGGPVRADVKDGDGLGKDLQWQHLLILVHGFNNSESEANRSYGAYVDMLLPGLMKSRVAPDAIAKFHWPGNEAIGPFPFMDFAGYHIDVGRALQSIDKLAGFLARLVTTGPAGRRISIVGHSLGCRLIAGAMCRLSVKNANGTPLSIVCLMAPAVPVALAEAGQELAAAPQAAHKVIKAHSHADWVLWLAFPAGQELAYRARIEKACYGEAMGRTGNPAGFGESLVRERNGHGDYWTDRITAHELLVAMDPTLRTLPAPVDAYSRDVMQAGDNAVRRLMVRDLPG